MADNNHERALSIEAKWQIFHLHELRIRLMITLMIVVVFGMRPNKPNEYK